jgi:dihydrofolate reductase
MTLTQYYVAASIDGYIADREGKLDWLMQFGFDEYSDDYEAFIADVGVIVMGARTYQFVIDEQVPEWPYAGQKTWVLTHRPVSVYPGADIRVAAGDVAALHAEWVEAAAGKNVWICGGGDIAAQVADAGLLDEILLTVMPVMIGGGTPLLPVAQATAPLSLVRTHLFESGGIGAVYRIPR